MRILAILQARVSSTRLPGKVLKPVLGEPMLKRQVERVQRAGLIDCLVIATSDDASDDAIEQMCRDNKLACFRGSLHDVLDRFYQAARHYNTEHVVRLTGDCPLTDPGVIDLMITWHLRHEYDYTSNSVERTFPHGLDAEVFRFSCLQQAWSEAVLPSHREHVTPFFYLHPARFHIGQLTSSVDLSHLRWTVDEPLDFELVTRIYESLYPDNPRFTTKDVLEFLKKNPELKEYNTCYRREAGMQKSLMADELFRQNMARQG